MICNRMWEHEKINMQAGKPEIIDVTPMKYLAVKRTGGQNSGYGRSLNALYEIARTIRASYESPPNTAGSPEYSLPLIESFGPWGGGPARERKRDSVWVYAMRLPDFATPGDCNWAVREASQKSGVDFSNVEFMICYGGFCVQCVHIGANDSKGATLRLMENFAVERGYRVDGSAGRFHHEIYLRDPRRTEPAGMETVIRLPVR